MSPKAILLSVLCNLILIAALPSPIRADEFNRTLVSGSIQFHITSKNEGSIIQVTIAPTGLEIDNSTLSREIDGTANGAEIADLNSDGSPEIYIFINSAGSGSYGSLVAYSANSNKSMSEIYLPDLMDDKANSQGYMGHDSFIVGETTLLRRFPVYRPGDPNVNPSGGVRELQYTLQKGEAGWLLVLEKSETMETTH